MNIGSFNENFGNDNCTIPPFSPENDYLEENSLNFGPTNLNFPLFDCFPLNNSLDEKNEAQKIFLSNDISVIGKISIKNNEQFKDSENGKENGKEKEKEKELNISNISKIPKSLSIYSKKNEVISPLKLFKIEKENNMKEKRRTKKEKENESIDKENLSYLNKKREIKGKPGRKSNRIKLENSHTANDFDNLLVLIQSHYFNFVINISNDVLKAELGNGFQHCFKNIKRDFKLKVKFDDFKKIKSSPIEKILNVDISKKYSKFKKNNNRITFFHACKKSNWLKEQFFKMKNLELFQCYYNYGIILDKKINIKDKYITLSENTKTFYDLKIKNKYREEILDNTVKRAYFDGKDILNKIEFKIIKK